MKTDEQTIQRILDVLSHRGNCDYAPVRGGVMLFDGNGGEVEPGIDISTFFELQREGLIAMISSMRQGHMVFPRNVRVDSYGITDKGREYYSKLDTERVKL